MTIEVDGPKLDLREFARRATTQPEWATELMQGYWDASAT